MEGRLIMGAQMFFREDTPRKKRITEEEYEKKYYEAFPNAKRKTDIKIKPLSYQEYLKKKQVAAKKGISL